MRRYNEFAALHANLSNTDTATGAVDKRSLPPLPAKQLVGNLKEETIDNRRHTLEAYLMALLDQPEV